MDQPTYIEALEMVVREMLYNRIYVYDFETESNGPDRYCVFCNGEWVNGQREVHESTCIIALGFSLVDDGENARGAKYVPARIISPRDIERLGFES